MYVLCAYSTKAVRWKNIISNFQSFTLNIYLFKTQLNTKTSQIIHNNLVTNVNLLTEMELCIISAVMKN